MSFGFVAFGQMVGCRLGPRQIARFAWKAALSGDPGEPSAVDEYLYDDADVLPMTGRARRANKRLTAEQ